MDGVPVRLLFKIKTNPFIKQGERRRKKSNKDRSKKKEKLDKEKNGKKETGKNVNAGKKQIL